MRQFLVVLLFSALSLNAQRCGYDYLGAFVVKVVMGSDSDNIEGLQLRLHDERNQPIKQPEFWANLDGRKTGIPALDQFYKLPINQNLYVIFFDLRKANSRNRGKVWWVNISPPPNYPGEWTKQLPIRASDGNHLCGHTGPFKIITLNLLNDYEQSDMGDGYVRQFPKQEPKPVISPPKKEEPPAVRPVIWSQKLYFEKLEKMLKVKGDYQLRDSLMIVNYSNERVELPPVKLQKTPQEQMLKYQGVSIPEFVEAKDTAWIVYDLIPSGRYVSSVLGLPYEEKNLEFVFEFEGHQTLSAKADYAMVDVTHLQSSEPVYRFKPTPIGWFWVFDIQENRLKSYGKCLEKNDTLLRIGDWYFSEPRNFIQYSMGVQLAVSCKGHNVAPFASVYQMVGGRKVALDKRYYGENIMLWVSPKTDTLVVEWGEYSNQLMGLALFSTQMFSVDLFKMNDQKYFKKQYPQMHTYQPYLFVDTQFMVKWNGSKKAELLKLYTDLNRGDLGIVLYQSDRYDENFLSLTFPLNKKYLVIQELRKWYSKGWIVEVYQGLELNKNQGITYFSGELYVKPKRWEWTPELQKLVKDFNMKEQQRYGDGTYVLKYNESIFDESLFQKMMEFSELPNWQHATPMFFNPIRQTLEYAK